MVELGRRGGTSLDLGRAEFAGDCNRVVGPPPGESRGAELQVVWKSLVLECFSWLPLVVLIDGDL